MQEEAAELSAENQAVLDEVAQAISGVDKLRVAQVYYEGGTLQAIGAGIEYDILKLAGSDNVYAPGSGSVRKLLRGDDHPRVAGRGRTRRDRVLHLGCRTRS